VQTSELLRRSRDFWVGTDGQVQIEERRWENDSYVPSCLPYEELFVGVLNTRDFVSVQESEIRRFDESKVRSSTRKHGEIDNVATGVFVGPTVRSKINRCGGWMREERVFWRTRVNAREAKSGKLVI
jgi:hypothetical protein